MGDKETVGRIEDALARGDEAVLDELMAADLVDHNPFPGQGPGLQGYKECQRGVRAAFTDASRRADIIVADGDLVVAHWSATATHAGDFMGVVATGRRVEVTGFDMFRMRDGRGVEIWTEFNGIGVLAQIGGLRT
jgi:predicted ester cyclase